jgi:hypothetical protein
MMTFNGSDTLLADARGWEWVFELRNARIALAEIVFLH